MKKVLMIASVPSMIGQFNMNNILLLQKMGYQVEVACDFLDRSVWTIEQAQRFENELQEKQIVRHQIDFTRNALHIGKHRLAYLQLKKLLDNEMYTFIHCHTPIAGALGRMAAHAKGIRTIYTAHGFHFYKGAPIINWILYYPVERFLARWTDLLIVINKEDYERAKKFHAGKVEYIPGVGIDTECIKKVIVDREKKRKELGIPEKAYVLLSVGELSKRKNHEIVIRALGQLKNKDVYYLICGIGELEGLLKKKAEKAELGNRVKILGFRRDIIEICKASDAFVFPSLQEGLPVALMEAMASGIPCIVSDIRGNRDLITEKDRIFKPKDVNTLIHSIGMVMYQNTLNDSVYMLKFDKKNIEKKMNNLYGAMS